LRGASWLSKHVAIGASSAVGKGPGKTGFWRGESIGARTSASRVFEFGGGSAALRPTARRLRGLRSVGRASGEARFEAFQRRLSGALPYRVTSRQPVIARVQYAVCEGGALFHCILHDPLDAFV